MQNVINIDILYFLILVLFIMHVIMTIRKRKEHSKLEKDFAKYLKVLEERNEFLERKVKKLEIRLKTFVDKSSKIE